MKDFGIGSGLGVALQWLRAESKFPEWAYVLLVFVGAFLLMWAVGGLDPASLFGPDRARHWIELGTAVAGAFTGTQVTSSGARVAQKAGLDPGHALVPVTDSK